MWSQSQERINAEALNKCAHLVIEVANEILHRAPRDRSDQDSIEVLGGNDGSSLYLLDSARRLRTELQTLEAHSSSTVMDLRGLFQTSSGWKGDLSPIQIAALQVVFRHLALDPDIR